jgi:hypothetical protein
MIGDRARVSVEGEGSAFSRMIGLWWGEQMSALRRLCSDARPPS